MKYTYLCHNFLSATHPCFFKPLHQLCCPTHCRLSANADTGRTTPPLLVTTQAIQEQIKQFSEATAVPQILLLQIFVLDTNHSSDSVTSRSRWLYSQQNLAPKYINHMENKDAKISLGFLLSIYTAYINIILICMTVLIHNPFIIVHNAFEIKYRH